MCTRLALARLALRYLGSSKFVLTHTYVDRTLQKECRSCSFIQIGWPPAQEEEEETLASSQCCWAWGAVVAGRSSRRQATTHPPIRRPTHLTDGGQPRLATICEDRPVDRPVLPAGAALQAAQDGAVDCLAKIEGGAALAPARVAGGQGRHQRGPACTMVFYELGSLYSRGG